MQKPNMPAEISDLMAGSDPAAVVDALARSARKERTPCGDGSIVWRVWGAASRCCCCTAGRDRGRTGSATSRRSPGISSCGCRTSPGSAISAMLPEPRTPMHIAEIMGAGLETLFAPGRKLHLAAFSFGGQVAGMMAARAGARFHDLTLIGVAALGLRADPREPFAKVRTGMSPAEVAPCSGRTLRC